MENAVNEVTDADFHVITKNEAFPITRFFDIGAVTYYLKAIPWQIPDFSIETYQINLQRIHQYMFEKGYLDIPTHRFYFISKK